MHLLQFSWQHTYCAVSLQEKRCKWVKQNVKRLYGVCVGVLGLDVRISLKRQRWWDCPNQMVSITWQIWVNTSSGDLSASICRWNQKCQSYNVYCGTHTQTQHLRWHQQVKTQFHWWSNLSNVTRYWRHWTCSNLGCIIILHLFSTNASILI